MNVEQIIIKCCISKYTYTTFVTTALLMPIKSVLRKFKSMAIGLLPPWTMSMELMRSGSSGGIAKPECPSGCSDIICVITVGMKAESPAAHCGISDAVIRFNK